MYLKKSPNDKKTLKDEENQLYSADFEQDRKFRTTFNKIINKFYPKKTVFILGLL